MKKKLLIIAFLGAIFSCLIYFYTKSDEITITALGDGLSLGMTPYNIEGYSFNDYLKESYENKHQLKKYFYEFAGANKTIKELIYEIKSNKSLIIKNEKVELQRAINEADILTISIGLDEIANQKITRTLKQEFTSNINELLSMIKMLNNGNVIVLGLYPTKNHDLLTIAKLNAIIRDAALSNKFHFIDITSFGTNPHYFLDSTSHYINYQAHQEIAQIIGKTLKS